MTQKIAGVDTSVSSPTTTVSIGNVTVPEAGTLTYTFTPTDLEKDRSEVMQHAIHQITIPSLRMLLTQMLNVIDIAVPNKDQNRAIKRTIREDFDTAYFGILGRAFPNMAFGQAEGSYALEPEPDKKLNTLL